MRILCKVTSDVNTDKGDHTQGPAVCIRTSSPHTPMPRHVTAAPYEEFDESPGVPEDGLYASSPR